MPKYRAKKQLYDGVTIRNPGEIFDFAGPGNPDTMEPIDGAPMAPRRFDLAGSEKLSLEKRAETVAGKPAAPRPKDTRTDVERARDEWNSR